MAFRAILVATDLTPASDEALRQALAIARGRHRVALCHVLPETRAVRPLFPQMHQDDALAALDLQAAARERLDIALSRVGNPDVDVFFDAGVPHTRIIERARACRADLIVVGGPETAPRPTGTADQVARRSPLPVLVARSSPTGPILAATDLSNPSLPALRTAARQAEALDRPLVALHVLEVERELSWLSAFKGVARDAYTSRVSSLIDDAGRELARVVAEVAPGAKGEVRQGRAADVIRTRAVELGASLVVVATHGRTGLDRALVGSVTEEVLRTAPCSVLVVRHEEAS